MPIILKPTDTPNLLRSENGTFYGRSKIGGKQVTKSLRTKGKRLAQQLLRDWLSELAAGAAVRIAAPVESDAWGPSVQAWLAGKEERPDLSAKSKKYYKEISAHVLRVAPAAARPREVTGEVVRAWWKVVAGERSANAANVALGAVREILAEQRARGLRRDNPAAELKKMRVGKSDLRLPSPDGFREIVAEIRRQHGRFSKETARLVEFFAWSGLRLSEGAKVRWEDVVPAGDGEALLVASAKARGGAQVFRRVPVVPALGELLAEMRAEWEAAGQVPTGPMWRIANPKKALAAACARLKVPHLSPHDLRHLFATTCIESGVDIPTVARWLGHSDGGALAMRVYGHLREGHSQAAARRVVF